MVDQRFHEGAHDLADVFGRVAQSVGAELQVGGAQAIFLSSTMTRGAYGRSRSSRCSTILSDSVISATRIR